MIRIPLASPSVCESDRQAVLDVLNTRSLSLGPSLTKFEGCVARKTRARFAIAVNSGTSGLHLAVKAAGLGERDEVITTAFSFVASANCILYERAVPKFIDIDLGTYNMDPARIEAAISARTRAILPVHIFGRPCPMDPIMEIARQHGLTVIEDACEALGARYRGKYAGTIGQTGVFGFYPNKQITTGEGGVIVTDDENIARLCRSWRNQGRGDNGAWLQHERLGYNYRLSEINCALGIAQLSRFDEILSARASVAAAYTACLRDQVPEVIPPAPAAPETEISWFVYVVRLRDEFSRADRDRVIQSLRNAGIGCSSYFSPIHLQPFYREVFGYRRGDFPVTEHVGDRTVALPFFTDLTVDQIETVCSALSRAIAGLKHR